MSENTAIQIVEDFTLPQAQSERWQLMRAGIQNIWEYDDQRFVFHHGRLLLRGRNESGKTKALEVLLPFLLDADLSPQRLDPFGSKARQMRWNLLNESNPDEKVHIGYVWLELGRRGETPETSEHRTIGAGLRAQRSRPGADVWYFVTPRRVDLDLHLFDAKRVPLTRTRLEEALNGRGTVYDRKSDYRRAVNRELFDMTEDQYAALVEALLQLRRPQLSKKLQPSELSSILTASLPPLDPTVVAQLAEAFDRLDQHRTAREEVARTAGAVRGFMDVYGKYVSTLARARARAVLEAEAELARARDELERREAKRDEALQRREALAQELNELERENRTLDERIEALRGSDEYRAVQELAGAERLAEALAARAGDVEERLATEEERLRRLEDRLAAATEEAEAGAQQLELARTEAARKAEEAGLSAEHRSVEPSGGSDLSAARGTLDSVLAARREAIEELSGEQERSGEAAAAAERAGERAAGAKEAVRQAREALDELARAEEEAAEGFAGEITAWTESLSELTVDDETRRALAELPPGETPAAVRRLGAAHAARLEEETSDVRVELRAAEARLGELREERGRVEAATHRAPDPPPWRSARSGGRPGAPLYLLCDFAVDDPVARASLEAALESSGLLDAWVTPTGGLLNRWDADAVILPEPRQIPRSETLADVLEPSPCRDVEAAVIDRVLRSVALVTGEAEEPAGEPCWVGLDGRWRLGPVRGAWSKPSPAFVGAIAREQERARRLDELDELISGVEKTRLDLRARLDRLAERRSGLDTDLDRFPDLRPLLDAGARVTAAAEQLASRQREAAEVAAAEARAGAILEERRAGRDAAAARLGLGAWVSALPELRERTLSYESAARELIRAAGEARTRQGELWSLGRDRGEARGRLEALADEARSARAEADRAADRAAALRESVGAGLDRLLASLRQAEQRRGTVRGRIEEDRRAKERADQRVGERAGAAEAAGADVGAAERGLEGAVAELRGLAAGGLLGAAGLETAGDPAAWSGAELLALARRLEDELSAVPHGREALDKAENLVVGRHQDLVRGLSSEVRVRPRREGGVLRYDTSFDGGPRRLWDLAVDLEADVAARDRLLGDEERQLFETFLSGEIHAHLRSRLREANRLVGRMNAQLERCPTASGIRLRLRWAPAEDAPAGTGGAIDLLLRSGELLSEADREALRRFLEGRLDEAHAREAGGTLPERMLAVLDYRTWFQFTVEYRPSGGTWRKLTRKVHSAGSGGQKAVMLHLPLFAAAAAFFESAGPAAPRLIVLDEAFAGIDRGIRGQLMGLLSALDLDFLMTSYDEWGFYEELDGLATYHLTRKPGAHGVYADRFVWDGRASREAAA